MIKMKRLISFLMFAIIFANISLAQDADSLYAKDLLTPGTEAPDFTLKSLDGKEYSLHKLNKKGYVVLDFWSSWCRDCLKDIPAVKALYEQYGKKVNFVGISFDDNKESWANCVEKNQIAWLQLSELKKWRDSEVSKLYHIKWIPTMYLLDPQGKVVLATVQVEKLEKKLKELF